MTKEKYELQKGWEAASRIYGTGAAAAMTGDYVFKVNEAISAFEKTGFSLFLVGNGYMIEAKGMGSSPHTK